LGACGWSDNGETGDAILFGSDREEREEFVLRTRPLELLPLWSTDCFRVGRRRDCDAAFAAALGPVGLSGMGFRFSEFGRGAGGMARSMGMLGRRFRSRGVVSRPVSGDELLKSSGSLTSATECKLE
jgi:hypothetical protein